MSIYLYMLVMALTTYLLRMLPLTVFRKPIKSRFVRSFLAYVPCACLACMTFPAILGATNSVISGGAALVVALIAAFWGRNLVTVAVLSSATVFVSELIIKFI